MKFTVPCLVPDLYLAQYDRVAKPAIHIDNNINAFYAKI